MTSFPGAADGPDRAPRRARDAIAMTPGELEAFLAGHHVMHLATLRASGAPHIVSMWYGLLDGCLVFSSYARSQKIVNLRRDGRVACQIEEGTHPSEVRGVCIEGVATVVDEPGRVEEIVRTVSLHALGAEPTERSLEAMGISKRAGVIIQVAKVASWDHRKVAGGYMRGAIPGE